MYNKMLGIAIIYRIFCFYLACPLDFYTQMQHRHAQYPVMLYGYPIIPAIQCHVYLIQSLMLIEGSEIQQRFVYESEQ